MDQWTDPQGHTVSRDTDSRGSAEMPAALRAELPLVRCHALGDARDIGNEPAADHPRIIGAILALLQRALGRLALRQDGI